VFKKTTVYWCGVNREILKNMTLLAHSGVSPPKKQKKKSAFPGILERILQEFYMLNFSKKRCSSSHQTTSLDH